MEGDDVGECESTAITVAGVTVASDAVTADESAVVADPIVGPVVVGVELVLVGLVISSRTLISSVMIRFVGDGDVVRCWCWSSSLVVVLVSFILFTILKWFITMQFRKQKN